MRKTATNLVSFCLLAVGLLAQPLTASNAAQSQLATQADAFLPPFQSDFSSDEGFALWTVIDANSDDKTWVSYYGDARVSYHSDNKMDDWLISPGLSLEQGKIYVVNFDVKCYGPSYPEKLEVKSGKANTVDSMTDTLLPETIITSDEFITYTVDLIPTEDGVYYIGFHGISDPDKYYIYLNNVKVSAGASGQAPGEASDLILTPDANGALKCNVSFKTPEKNYLGEPLSELTEVDVLRDGNVVKTFQNPDMGVTLSFEDVLESGGNIEYSIICRNNQGNGPSISGIAFVGFDKPAAATEVHMERTDLLGNATITWVAPTEDVNGLTLTENDVLFRIYSVKKDYYGNLELDKMMFDGIKGNSFSYQFVEEGKQQFLQYAIIPYTSGGEGAKTFTEVVLVGTPYEGYSESFSNMTPATAIQLQSTTGSISLTNGSYGEPPVQDGDGGYVKVYMAYSDNYAEITTGFISLANLVNPTLSFYTYNETYGYYEYPNNNLLSVEVLPIGAEEWINILEPKAISEFFEEEELNVWKKIVATIPAEYGDKILQVKIKINQDGSNSYSYIDNIVLESLLDYDLTVTNISAPVSVKTGLDYSVKVSVKNKGYFDADSYNVELYADEVLLDSKTESALPSQAETLLTFTAVMSPLAENPVSLYAKVTFDKDQNSDNDKSEIIEVSPKLSDLPTAEDLIPEASDDGVTLMWTAPDLANMVSQPVTESFEFGQFGDNFYEGWTFVDKDETTLQFMQDLGGLKSGETKGAFFVLDIEEPDWVHAAKYTPHSGTHCIFATRPSSYSNKGDDWAISPELSGDAQTITFWAKSTSIYDNYYLEQFEVLYSTGSLETEDFIPIEESLVPAVPISWTEYSVDLPAGAMYFAIRSFDKNEYQLMIDDVSYAPVNPSTFEIEGYNIYRNGVKINEAPVADTTFKDTEAPEGNNTYHVTVVYKDRGESRGISADITTTGADALAGGNFGVYAEGGNIVIVGAEGEDTVVSSVSGSVLFSGKASSKTIVPAAKGIYVVKAGKVAKKVIVK